MKEKVKNIISNIGGQIDMYSPLVSSTGYVISKLEVKLLFGILPSVTPHISKVSEPDIGQMISFLKMGSGQLATLVNDADNLVRKLEEIEQKIEEMKVRAQQARVGAEQAVAAMGEIATSIQQRGPSAILESPEYRALLQEAILLLSSKVKSPVLSKLLSFVAGSVGGESLTLKGYEMRDFSIDLGVLPSVSFSLTKI